MEIPLLTSIVIFLPALGALAVALQNNVSSIRWTALGTTLLTFVLSLGLWWGYDPAASAAAPQMADVASGWFPASLDVKYFVGIDGLNIFLILLTTLLGPIVVASSWTYIEKKHRGYYSLFLLLQTGITGVFASYDLILFYIFFELTLIPMYFIIGIWGGEDRIYAAIKFVLYTLVGSLLMLVAILFLGFEAGNAINQGVFTTDWFKLLEFTIPVQTQAWLFVLFALSFAIKVPLFPLHTWLPDAHVQAPTGGSVILAGVLLKMGTYGLVRFCLPLFPNAAQDWALVFAILAVIGIIYGALVARVQPDAKKLVAYSSVSHLGFVVLGIFAFTDIAMQGAVIQMVNHGISTGALFLIVGMLYERRHTRLMEDYGGLATSVPVLTSFMIFSVLASAGLPGLNGFVGEFLILVGTFKSEVIASPVIVGLATTGVILAAVYLLYMVYATFFGELTNEANATMPDMNGRELALMLPLAVLMFVMGFFPTPFLKQMEPSTTFIMETIEERRADALELQRMQEGMEEGRAVRVTPAGPETGSKGTTSVPTALPNESGE
ncbi:Fe-S-binding domain-containing protein [Longibacter salinarum]|uniref:Fe-S-binding domain-containing protein n=1 Tax=Longibacter salinarum TaxID=1850348 RepID=A0A2A8D1P7_9BACT|nr:NADH-quinone oxidoreductase subunit M [Longibacter salinarum]PEN14889.1 Fe-S-binding domain-containing protein [Longibacter salinarum]